MPSYDYRCNRCNCCIELTHSMKECDAAHPCPTCGAGMERQPAQLNVKPPPDKGWENLNGGRGKAITQFINPNLKPGHPDAIRYFRSQKELLETGKREGYRMTRTR